MRNALTAAALAASLGLAACSERTEENAESTAGAAASDVEAGASEVGQAAEGAVAETGEALGQVGDAVEGAAAEAGQEIEEAGQDLQK
jgi:hypothetical protein